jgi:hypothetical protein
VQLPVGAAAAADGVKTVFIDSADATETAKIFGSQATARLKGHIQFRALEQEEGVR